jgi:Ran GTPase-activating protein (RanGAP) involved in mRNA processing and transport
MLCIIYFFKIYKEAFFSLTVGANRLEELQRATVVPQTWVCEDAMCEDMMCLAENNFIENPLNGEEVHRYLEDLGMLSSPMYDDCNVDDANYFADGEESSEEEEEDEDEDWNSMSANVGDSDYCNDNIED